MNNEEYYAQRKQQDLEQYSDRAIKERINNVREGKFGELLDVVAPELRIFEEISNTFEYFKGQDNNPRGGDGYDQHIRDGSGYTQQPSSRDMDNLGDIGGATQPHFSLGPVVFDAVNSGGGHLATI